MIKLQVDADTEILRKDFRNWLNINPPPQNIYKNKSISLNEYIRVGKMWQEQLSDGKWIGVHWSKEFGGRGLNILQEAVIQEELVRVNSPQILGLFGISMVGPVLLKYGSQLQKERYLSKILNAQEIWCQGFSETVAGSDLSSLKTYATKVEGGYILNGSKVWTSFAQIADLCFVLCRTSNEEVKYKGLSYILLDMKSKGITVRPLKQISGDNEFNEVFFENVFVPYDNLVGKEGQGWSIAISTLMYERVILTFARQLQSETLLKDLLKRIQNKDISEISKYKISKEILKFCMVRSLAYTHLLEYAKNNSLPGPEGSLDKLFWTESFQSLAKLNLELDEIKDGFSEQILNSSHQYLYSRGRSIAAGTSEIQKNIISERLLGLPRLSEMKN